MYSFLCAVWAWTAENANLLLNLADAGRMTGNTTALVIAATLAIIKIAALVIFIGVGFWRLMKWILVTEEYEKKGVPFKETRIRFVLLALVIASILFEMWACPTRRNGTTPDNLSAVSTVPKG